jgi:hypothetical protein
VNNERRCRIFPMAHGCSVSENLRLTG